MAELEPPAGENDKIEQAAQWLQGRKNLLFITGAGMSADSGLPTYRGIGGLYHDAGTEEGLSIEEALSGTMLELRPAIPWRHILRIEQACRGAGFNRGHAVLAEMERHFPRVWVLTQNVDGFHRAAGSKKVIDIHGDIHNLRCTRCWFRQTVADYSGLQGLPPLCPECQATLRPEVVLFGELLPQDKLVTLEHELARGFDLVFSIGTTSVFPYITRPVLLAKRRGVPTVEINPGQSLVTDAVDLKLSGGAAATLDAIWKKYLDFDRSDESDRSDGSDRSDA